jgi:hypothetical protein
MSDKVTTKFEQVDIDSITELRDATAKIINDLGQAEVQLLFANEQMAELNKFKETLQSKYIELQAKEQLLLKELNEKYGKGTLDINTGEFVPEN